MDNQEDGPSARPPSIASTSIFITTVRGRRREGASERERERGQTGEECTNRAMIATRVRKREQDYYFNGGLIWRVHTHMYTYTHAHTRTKSNVSRGEIVGERSVMGASIAAGPKYIFEIYPTPRSSLSRLAGSTAPSRTPVETVHCADIRPVRYCRLRAHPRFHPSRRRLWDRASIRIRTYVSRVYTLVIRDLLARRAYHGGEERLGGDYIRDERRAPRLRCR